MSVSVCVCVCDRDLNSCVTIDDRRLAAKTNALTTLTPLLAQTRPAVTV